MLLSVDLAVPSSCLWYEGSTVISHCLCVLCFEQKGGNPMDIRHAPHQLRWITGSALQRNVLMQVCKDNTEHRNTTTGQKLFWELKAFCLHSFLISEPTNLDNLTKFSNRLQRTYVKIQRYAISIYKDLPMNISWTYQMYINRKSKRNKVNYSITSLVNLFFFAAPLLRQWRQSRRVIYIYNI